MADRARVVPEGQILRFAQNDRMKRPRHRGVPLPALFLSALVAAVFGAPGPASAGVSSDISGSWSSGAPMPTARTEVTSAVVGDVIYVIGGVRSPGSNPDLVEAYATAGNSWSTKAPLPQALDHAGAAAAVGGKVYVVGGYISLSQGTISSATYE